MDLQALLSETASQPPCGPALDYDPQFMALETAAQGKPEQEVAGRLVPAVEPEWSEVRDKAIVLLGRSKDLRVAMLLIRALTRTEHLSGFVAGITFINGLLDRFWADLHPHLDADDNNDPTLRMNALAAIEAPKGVTGTETLLRDLRDALVVPPGPKGRVSVRDVLILDGKLPAAGESLSAAAINGLLRAAVDRDGSLADIPATAVREVKRTRELLAAKVGEELAPDVDAALNMLKPVTRLMAQATGQDVARETSSGGGQSAGPAPALDGIRSRDEIVRAIDAICAFLERTEPANPAPLLLRRAQRLLNKSFVELVRDLAPEGVAQVKLIAGLKDE